MAGLWAFMRETFLSEMAGKESFEVSAWGIKPVKRELFTAFGCCGGQRVFRMGILLNSPHPDPQRLSFGRHISVFLLQ